MRKLALFFTVMLMTCMAMAQSVVDIIVNSPDHTILEAAVIAAELDDDLSGPGPFTVFAPTDDAFAALPDGTVEALLQDPTGALAQILLYHVVGATALSTDLFDGQTIVTLNGASVTVSIVGGNVFINDAQVTVADIIADNGVVHVINAVLLPPAASNTVVDIIVNSPDHNILEAAVIAAELADALSGEGPFTVFAPTDDAFAALPDGTVEALLQDPTGALAQILLYHVVAGTALSTDLSDGQNIITLNGASVTVSIVGGNVFINDAQVTVADIIADNGVVHVINAVLLPPAASNTVVDIIVNSPDHNILEAAVIAADLADVLSGEGPFTVFAPTDAAFEALPPGTIEALLNDIPTLSAILTYHVAAEDIRSTDLLNGQIIVTVNGQLLVVTINNDGVFINNAQVTVADLVADNGVVHVIDAVLLPVVVSETVFDLIANSADHNILEAAILAAGLDEALNGDGPFVVFAPTDAAFEALPDGVIEALLDDPQGELTQILLYHVAAGDDAPLGPFFDGQTIVTLSNGQTLTVTADSSGIFINNAQIIVAGLLATNGIVHVIDAVLLPPAATNTVVDIIVNSPDHNILEVAVIAAELADVLSGDGPFTVFAPTDAAFEALPPGTVEALLDDPTGALAQILLYHVVGANALSTDLSDGQTIVTLNGASVTVSIEGGNVFINDAQVTVADIIADNGVVHVIDAVLLPPAVSNTVFDIIINSPVHNILSVAIIAAELDDALRGDGPFTVFAPTDAAFEALPPGTVEALLDDPTGALAQILLYHVVGATALSTDLSDGQTIVTLNGASVIVSIEGGNVFINDAQVTVADIIADNGVVHVINAVLLPPAVSNTVVDIIVNSPDHNILETAVIAAELADVLSGAGPFTVFAPTDAAFEALPPGTVEALLDDPTGALAQILLYHVVGATALSTDLSNGQSIVTLNGASVTVSITGGNVFINNAQVTVADIIADNGVVHVINAVLLPTVGTSDLNIAFPDVTIFPNPASSRITLDLSAIQSPISQIRMLDMNGRTVRSERFIGGVESIEVSDLASGLYFLEFNIDNKFYFSKIMINRK